VRRGARLVQVGTRLPDSLRVSLKKAAKANGASLNAEMVRRLQQSFERETAEQILCKVQTLLNGEARA
jgi:hypothetical protein